MDIAGPRHLDQQARLALACRSLEGLSVGDALGGQGLARVSPWRWSDDTAMALSVVEGLAQFGLIDPDWLAQAFVRRWSEDPDRQYGGSLLHWLHRVARGDPWRQVASAQFGGQGSAGNGAAVRVAPLGAFLCDDLDAVAEQATRSAEVTHAHPDAVAGSIAVAIAAAVAAREGAYPEELLCTPLSYLPDGPTKTALDKIARIPLSQDPREVADSFGNGSQGRSSDTVPFCLWCAARHLMSFEEAVWTVIDADGDADTAGAIVGGIVALSSTDGVPVAWCEAREPLPDWFFGDSLAVAPSPLGQPSCRISPR